MKKTLLTLGVMAAAVCGTLAYAVTRQGSLPTMFSFGTTQESASEQGSRIVRNPQLDPASVALAKARVQKAGMMRTAEQNDSASSEGMSTIRQDMMSMAEVFYPSSNSSFDESNRTWTFTPGETNFCSLTGVNAEETDYMWMSTPGVEYIFSGHIAATDTATVTPCILYLNTDEGRLYYAGGTEYCLESANGFELDFYASSYFNGNYPLYLGFIVNKGEASTEFTATDLEFYYNAEAIVAQPWSSENDLPGLGLTPETGDAQYIVKLEDGVTTLGLNIGGSNMLILRGINTTATEVHLPKVVSVNGVAKTIEQVGGLTWEGAPNLKVLDLNPAYCIYETDFSTSSITDLYVPKGFDFTGDASYFANVYLHLPQDVYDIKADYKNLGFKRVLVGEETPDCPETERSFWVAPGVEEGDYIGYVVKDGKITISEIFSDKESVMLPESALFVNESNNGYYLIRGVGKDSDNYENVLCANAPNLKSLTFPWCITDVNIMWSATGLTELHLAGDVPTTYWTVPSEYTVYVMDQSYYSNYENNSNWNNATILPDGWEFEWLTVNVQRKGEFAQTYIEMTGGDWALGTYVKVTGTLNEADLKNIKQLTNLRNLDLSEATFAGLPDNFMSRMNSLLEVRLSENVQFLPANAFGYCRNLVTVTAPGVELLKEGAFQGCGKLRNFDISKLTYIGNNAFEDCTEFNPGALPETLTYIGHEAFRYTAITEAVIPEGITAVGNNLFYGCGSLVKVTLPSTIRTIGSYAFYNCRQLTDLVIPEAVTEIRDNAFYNCNGLTEITLPSNLENLGYSVFYNCSNLHTIKCKAIVPPLASGTFTDGIDLTHCTLYVASFAIDAYREAQYWSDFYIMKPLNEPVKNIYISRPMAFDLMSEDNAILQDNPNLTLDYNYNSNYGTEVGQLTATGDGTLSAGVFKIFHRFNNRENSYNDYRTTLLNNAENMRADSVMCSIQFEKNCWHFISFQYDVKMEDIFGLNGTDFVIRQYNGQNRATGDGSVSNWEDVPADGTLLAGKGYIIQTANNSTNANGNTNSAIVRFPSRNTTTKNNLFTSGNVIVPLEEYAAEFAHNRSWNLVGNPYPCYYDMHCLLDDFMSPITLWRGSSYQAYSPVDDDIILRPNEAFFVQRPLDAEQMTFGVEGRMHYDDALNATNNNSATPGVYGAPGIRSNRSVFNFTVNGCESNDRARIVLNEDASMDYEIACDASKFFAETSAGAEIYVDGAVQYSICERPLDNGEALLGMRIARNGEYTISLTGRDMEGWSVMLTDNLTGVTVNLSETAYTFNGEAGTYEGRFTVRFNAPGESGINCLPATECEGNVKVVNVAGMEIFSGNIEDFKATAQPGVYVVISKEAATKIVVK